MNTTLSTFLKIAITAVTIGALLFGVAYTMTDGQVTKYETEITNIQLPKSNN